MKFLRVKLINAKGYKNSEMVFYKKWKNNLLRMTKEYQIKQEIKKY